MDHIAAFQIESAADVNLNAFITSHTPQHKAFTGAVN